MAKGFNKARKARLKKELLNTKTKSIKEAVVNAGYSENSAINAHRLSVVKCCLAEIEAEISEEITVEEVIKQLQTTRLLALEKKDYATAAYCSTQLGKYLAMFTDKSENKTTLSISEQQQRQEALHNRFSLQ